MIFFNLLKINFERNEYVFFMTSSSNIIDSSKSNKFSVLFDP